MHEVTRAKGVKTTINVSDARSAVITAGAIARNHETVVQLALVSSYVPAEHDEDMQVTDLVRRSRGQPRCHGLCLQRDSPQRIVHGITT